MTTPFHPDTVKAINDIFAPAMQVAVALCFLAIIGFAVYGFRQWLKRDEIPEPSEYAFGWEDKMRAELERLEGRE